MKTIKAYKWFRKIGRKRVGYYFNLEKHRPLNKWLKAPDFNPENFDYLSYGSPQYWMCFVDKKEVIEWWDPTTRPKKDLELYEIEARECKVEPAVSDRGRIIWASMAFAPEIKVLKKILNYDMWVEQNNNG